jgi:hypothetical protein
VNSGKTKIELWVKVKQRLEEAGKFNSENCIDKLYKEVEYIKKFG